jgi:hypothetical protein
MLGNIVLPIVNVTVIKSCTSCKMECYRPLCSLHPRYDYMSWAWSVVDELARVKCLWNDTGGRNSSSPIATCPTAAVSTTNSL